ncbi:MAG: DUF885 domain-containing protein [Pseudomonadota bacterium]|nr:DUF885 domain-containing protein [Pseudomonadota bacterium]
MAIDQRACAPRGGVPSAWRAALVAAMATLAGGASAAADFDGMATEFIHASLAMSPVAASDAGYHRHAPGKGRPEVRLDSLLDQVDAPAQAQRVAFLQRWRARFGAIEASALDREQQTDLMMLDDAIDSELLERQTIGTPRHNPALYVEMVGDALFRPMSQSYAAPPVRLGQALDRLAQVPRFLRQVRAVVESADPVFIDAAREENSGNIDLVEHDLRAAVAPYPALARRHARLAPAALRAMHAFDGWLKGTLAQRRGAPSWRIGGPSYARSFTLTMEAALEPAQLLADARQAFGDVRADLLRLALPLHREWFGQHGDHENLTPAARENAVIREVLDRIAEDHVQAADLLPHVDGELQSISDFIRAHDLVSLGDNSNLRVIPTPLFFRATYSVAGFSPPPALDPDGEAQYWVTPIDPQAPAGETESRLREYNNQTLRWLTIHEALPGHYVQGEHANRVQPEGRRLLRALYANGAYVEGWAEYIAQVLLDAGYQGDDPRFRIVMRKIRLRLLANTILDISLHTQGMSDQEAMALMTDGALQTEAEAKGKLRRAKLSHVQLATYYVGLRAWQKVRQQVEAQRGTGFQLRAFHDQALDEGAVPLARLGTLLEAR